MAGQRLHKGLNENLGREILELHTLGVDGGYTQDDVEALARILTGWSVARLMDDADAGTFKFYERAHEPGAKTLLGKRYAEAGRDEGVAALRRSRARIPPRRAMSRQSSRAISSPTIRRPTRSQRIAAAFRDSGGDLARVTAAVVREDAVWRTPFAKLRTPDDMLIAACRVTGFTPQPPLIVGEPAACSTSSPSSRRSPRAGPTTRHRGSAPEAVLRRAQWCEAFADRMPDPPDPVGARRRELRRGAARRDARGRSRRAPIAPRRPRAALASPEFQRR